MALILTEAGKYGGFLMVSPSGDILEDQQVDIRFEKAVGLPIISRAGFGTVTSVTPDSVYGCVVSMKLYDNQDDDEVADGDYDLIYMEHDDVLSIIEKAEGGP